MDVVDHAARLLREATDVTLLGHVHPDADAAGSALALALALRQRGADVRVAFGEQPVLPESLAGLDTDGLVVPPGQLPPSEPLLVTLDTPTRGRLGGLAPRVDAVKREGGSVLVIDHHVSNTFYGTDHVVDASAVATAVVVLRVIDALGAELDADIANCLYAGVLTDTTAFRRVDADTHRVAARLVEAGADPTRLAYELMDARPYAWLPMLAGVLAGAEFDAGAVDGLGLVTAVVTPEAATTVRDEEVEGVIEVVRAVREAEVAAVLKPAGPGRWRVSLRAKDVVDVSAVAGEFGGGGHRLAAGCVVDGAPDDVLGRLKQVLAQEKFRR